LLASSEDENVFCPDCCAVERTNKHPVKSKAATASLGRSDP
jgi:hypothetical protein